MARTPAWRRRPLIGLALLLALVTAAYLAGTGGDDRGRITPSAVSPTAPTPSVSSSAPVTDPLSRLPVVVLADLPPEAADTLALIAVDGPYPYERDGAEFLNREGLLPQRPAGWYREFTVPTPGEDDRGARRIVTADDGAAYYTGDHYDSFVVVGYP